MNGIYQLTNTKDETTYIVLSKVEAVKALGSYVWVMTSGGWHTVEMTDNARAVFIAGVIAKAVSEAAALKVYYDAMTPLFSILDLRPDPVF